MQKKTFAIIGLGTFGSSLAKELIRLNQDVICIDKDEEAVAKMSEFSQHVITCDATDEKALLDIGIDNVDHAIVAVGTFDQTMTLSTLILKELGVKYVTVKVKDDWQYRVMVKLGADEVIFPERIMARKLAQKISARHIVDITELGDDFSYVEFNIPSGFIGKSLDQIDFRKKYKLNVVAVKRNGVVGMVNVYDAFQENDVLIIVGFNDEIEKFDKLYDSNKL